MQLFKFTGPRAAAGKILLVDDNPLRASMRTALLERSAPAIVRALDASEALCLVESPEFAQELMLVITGHTMSGISGPEFVAELRTRMPQVPVLVLSAMADADKEYAGISEVCVSQTSSPDELRALVNQLVTVGERRSA